MPITVGTRLVVLSVGVAVVVGIVHGTTAAPHAQAPAASVTLLRQRAYLKASNTDGADHFSCGGSLPGRIGNALAISGDGNTLAVAAPWEASSATGVNGDQDDNAIPQAGAVYVFTRAGETWTQHAYLKASNAGRRGADDNGEGDQFGFSVALSADGGTLAAGAVSEDSNATGINGNQRDDSAASSGAVYVFARAGNSWTQQAYIKGANTGQGDLFGYGVGLSADGTTMAVAGYDEDGSGRGVNAVDDNALNGTGAIYVFERASGTWRETGYFKGSRSQRNDALWYSVAISADGNTIAGGAGDEACLNGGINPSGCDIDTYPEQLGAGSAGAAYIWVRSGDSWTEQAFIKASNPELADWFAARLALNSDGSRLLVGAQMEDSAARGLNGRQDDNSVLDAGARRTSSPAAARRGARTPTSRRPTPTRSTSLGAPWR